MYFFFCNKIFILLSLFHKLLFSLITFIFYYFDNSKTPLIYDTTIALLDIIFSGLLTYYKKKKKKLYR